MTHGVMEAGIKKNMAGITQHILHNGNWFELFLAHHTCIAVVNTWLGQGYIGTTLNTFHLSCISRLARFASDTLCPYHTLFASDAPCPHHTLFASDTPCPYHTLFANDAPRSHHTLFASDAPWAYHTLFASDAGAIVLPRGNPNIHISHNICLIIGSRKHLSGSCPPLLTFQPNDVKSSCQRQQQ